jgi:hypothetical protein
MPSHREQPERPRQEPEIIPPGTDWPQRDSPFPPQSGFDQRRGTHRIYVARIGPLGFALFMLIAALFGGVLLLALIGAALIWFPVLLLFAVMAAIFGLIRRL